MNKNFLVKFDTKLGRYIIVDKDGKIIDDAQGYGFKTIKGAYKALYWKQNYDQIYEESVKITEWRNSHTELYEKIMDDFFHYEIKDRQKLTTSHIKAYLNKIDEFSDAPFEPYKMYKHYDSAYKTVRKHKK